MHPVEGRNVLDARYQGRWSCHYPRHAEPAGKDLPSQSFQEKISLGLFSFQEKDVTPDKNLLSKVREAALWLETSDSRLAQPSQSTTASIADFFLALTICNSVMVSTTTEPRKRVRTDDGWERGQGKEKSGKANRKRKTLDSERHDPSGPTMRHQPTSAKPRSAM